MGSSVRVSEWVLVVVSTLAASWSVVRRACGTIGERTLPVGGRPIAATATRNDAGVRLPRHPCVV